MKYRRFGRTELDIPVISCGGMRFQQSWKADDPVGEESQQNLEQCIRRAYELGINHFETARGYGTSEQQLGRILPGMPRERIIVQTKVNPNRDSKIFADAFELSMRLLRLDYVDLFAIHGVNNDDLYEQASACIEQALEWKRQGRIRWLGFSTHGPADVIIRTIKTGVFDYVNLHWYYIFQNNWPAIKAARQRDMGVFIISPNDKGGLLYKPSAKVEALTAPLHPIVFNDLYCLARPEVHTLSCGASCPDDFDIHAEAADRLDEAEALAGPIAARLDAECVRMLGQEWMDTWHAGLPEWHETPGHINIPVMLHLRNLVLAFDMLEYARMRYNLLGNGGHWFPGNRADHLEELDLSECLAASPHRELIPRLLKETHEMLAGERKKRLQQEEG